MTRVTLGYHMSNPYLCTRTLYLYSKWCRYTTKCYRCTLTLHGSLSTWGFHTTNPFSSPQMQACSATTDKGVCDNTWNTSNNGGRACKNAQRGGVCKDVPSGGVRKDALRGGVHKDALRGGVHKDAPRGEACKDMQRGGVCKDAPRGQV